MARIDELSSTIVDHSALIILLMLLLTGVFAVGLTRMEESTSVSGLSDESETQRAYDYVQRNFSARGPNTTVTLVAVSNESGNALSKASIVRTLRYQRTLETNATLNQTLAADQATISVANVVARAAVAAERQRSLPEPRISQWNGSDNAVVNTTTEPTEQGGPPTLDEQIAQIESMENQEVSAVVERVLDPETSTVASRTAYQLLPREYEPGTTNASTHLIVMTQETEGTVRAAAALSEEVSTGQQAARELGDIQPGSESYHVYGRGLVSPQQNAAMSDSLAILGPLALLFVMLSLTVAYRDPVDILLGLVGVGFVLVWAMGSLGWLGIPFNQTMIAVPILLIGLSVDYALHVTMRYRERRADRGEDVATSPNGSVADAMKEALASVGPALVLVTLTTAIGFLANLTSALGDIRAFGIVTAIGIGATLIVFGVFVPAAKTLVGSFLARFGFDDTPPVLGTARGVRRVLNAGSIVARRAPAVVLVLALLLSAGGAYGATQINVATPQTAFMADNPPEWTEHAPESIQPRQFSLKDDRAFIYANFQSPDKQGYVLLTGNITAPAVFDRIAAADQTATRSDAVIENPRGEASVVTPLSAMQQAAEANATFNATFQASDTDGDGVPDKDIGALYDAFYAAAPDLATRTVHRDSDGQYTALRIRIATKGNLDRDTAVAPLTDAADQFETLEDVEAVATGQPVISKRLNDRLATTMIESLSLTIAVILVLLAVVFRLREGSASLGALTLLPVLCSVSWLLGTMALLDIPIGLITAMVGSLSVGLGVDYAIHISERFAEERRECTNVAVALRRTTIGTGSALLSSAVTTAAGFGVLSFSLLPALQQFGLVLALGIIYSFIASIYVQPSLLSLWERYAPVQTAPSDADLSTSGD